MTVAASTAVAATAPERDEVPSLREFVAHSGLQSVVLGSSKDPNAKVTILLVSPETRRPVYAVKVPTTDVAAVAVEAEARLLSRLQRSDGVGSTVPEFVAFVEHRGRRALVTTALSGTPLSQLYFRTRHTASRRRVARDLAATASWLRAFQLETWCGTAPMQLGEGVGAYLRERFGSEGAVEDDVAQLDEIVAGLRSNVVTRTAVHGDFWFGNVLVTGGRVSGVVDWEAAAEDGDAMRDVVRFALSYALYLDRRTRPGRRVAGHRDLTAGRWGAGVDFALEGTGWFPEELRAFLRSGLARLGASPDSWRGALLAGVAEVAAFTDDHEFARNHLELFRRLTRRQVWRAPA